MTNIFKAWTNDIIVFSRWIMKRRKYFGWFLLWSAVALTPSITLYARESSNARMSGTARAIQASLYLKGLYDGPIDGICNEKTLLGLKQNAALGGENYDEAAIRSCTSDALSFLTKHKANETKAGKPEIPSDINIIKGDVAEIQKELNNEHRAIEDLTAKFGDQFAAQFHNLATVGISTLITSISILIAFIAFIGNVALKDAVKAAHEAEMERARNQLELLTRLANDRIHASVYGTIGGQFVDIYKNIPNPTGEQSALLKSYLTSAIVMSKIAYTSANSVVSKLDSHSTVISEADKQRYIETRMRCLNNYTFYLAQRCLERDKLLIEEFLPELIKAADSRKKGGEAFWWSFQDTVQWAKLHLGRISAIEAQANVQALLDASEADPDWKKGTVANYKLYNALRGTESSQIVVSFEGHTSRVEDQTPMKHQFQLWHDYRAALKKRTRST